VIVIGLQDVVVLIPLAAAWLREARTDFGIDLDIETHLNDMQEYMNSDKADVLALQTDDGKIVGYMGIRSFPNPLGRGFDAYEHLMFVHPDYRGMGAVRLIRAAENWAKYHGCNHLILNASYMASAGCDRVCKLYEKMGYRPFEKSYIRAMENNDGMLRKEQGFQRVGHDYQDARTAEVH